MRVKALTILFFCSFFCSAYGNENLIEGFSQLEKGAYSKAFSIFSSIKRENPEVLTGKGISKYFLKDYKNSLKYLEKALKYPSEKKNWVTNYFAGLASYEMGNYSKALFYFNIANLIKPSKEITLSIGKTLYKMGNFIESERYLSLALKENPKNIEIYELLFSIYEKFENYEKLENTLTLARNELGNIPLVILYDAKILTKKGEINKAKKMLESIPKDKYEKNINDFLSTLPGIKVETTKPKKIALTYRFLNKVKISYIFIISLITLTFAGILYRNRKKTNTQKLEYALELLKVSDISGCEEILDSILPPYSEDYKILKIKLLALKGNIEKALHLCEDLNDKKTKESLKAYIYLISNDLIEFQKQVDLIEISIDKDLASSLSELSIQDKETLIKNFIVFAIEKKSKDQKEQKE
jgi:hypothetical protein